MLRPFGVLFIIAGTAVGGGMLGLPLVSHALSSFSSLSLLCIAWGYSLFAGLVLHQLFIQHNTANLPQLVQKVFGTPAQYVMKLSFMSLCISLLSAYGAAGSEVLDKIICSYSDISYNPKILTPLFCIFLSYFIYTDMEKSDYLNRFLFILKIICLITASVLLCQSMGWALWRPLWEPFPEWHQSSYTLNSTFFVFLAAFGYHVVLPSLFRRTQKRSIVKLLCLSSLIPLCLYSFWDTLIKGALFYDHDIAAHVIHAPQQLKAMLFELEKHSVYLETLLQLFYFFALSTSYIGVGFAFYDYNQRFFQKRIAYCVTFLVPMAVTLLIPKLFLTGIKWAGVASTMYAMLIPGLIAFKTLAKPFWRYGALLSSCISFWFILNEIISLR